MERIGAIGDNAAENRAALESPAMATAELTKLMTAEEFGKRPDPGYPEELVRGEIVPMALTDTRHGEVCVQSSYLLKRFLEDHDLGRVIGNDAGVITARGPDSVRGPDIAFFSYLRLPKGQIPRGYQVVAPELVIEVRSPSDRWRAVQAKVVEYLDAGVLVVVVLDPDPRTAHVFAEDDPPRVLSAEEDLTLAGVLEGFAVRVGKFFE
jgi:Uma2 family endonuclease